MPINGGRVAEAIVERRMEDCKDKPMNQDDLSPVERAAGKGS